MSVFLVNTQTQKHSICESSPLEAAKAALGDLKQRLHVDESPKHTEKQIYVYKTVCLWTVAEDGGSGGDLGDIWYFCYY